MMPYEFSFVAEDMIGTGILSALLSGIPSGMVGIATYVLTSLALYTVAQRRGLNRPWLAWIPVINCWIIGSLSDQYQYVVKGQIRSKRKLLLILKILAATIGTAAVSVCIAAVIQVLGSFMRSSFGPQDVMKEVLGSAAGILGLCLPLAAVSVAAAVIRYMALYDIYRSMDPDNCVLFLVLSILFGITEPFFLFFNRNKDLGMPPRRQEQDYREEAYQDYVYVTEEPKREPWNNTDDT